MYLHETAINLYNQVVRFYATNGYVPGIGDLEIDTRTWHKATILLYQWGWIAYPRPGVLALNRPTERDMTPGELAALYFQRGVKPL